MLLSVLSACSGSLFDSPITVPNASGDPLFAVEALFLPSDTSYVYLTRTSKLNESVAPVTVPNANVRLTVGSTELVLDARQAQLDILGAGAATVFYYTAVLDSALFVQGTPCSLTISLADGTVLKSQSVIPPLPPVPDLALRSDRGSFERLNLSITLNDERGADFYLLRGSAAALRRDPDFPPTDSIRKVLLFQDVDLLSERHYGPYYVFSDAAFDGVRFQRSTTLVNRTQRDSTVAHMTFYTINRAGFDYLAESQIASSLADNILVEPNIISSNIEGGLGGFIVTSRPRHRRILIAR